MRNLELVESDPTAQLAEFKRGAALLQAMADQHRGLIINGPDDKDGFKRVHSARMTLKNARVSIEADRKKLKEAALKYGRAVDTEAARLTAIIQPVESALQAQEDDVQAELNRIKEAAEAEKRRILAARCDAFNALGVVQPAGLATMSEDTFCKFLNDAKAEYLERKRIEAEQEAARAAERAELDRQRAEQEARQLEIDRQLAEIEAEKRKIADAEAERERAALEAKRKAEAFQQAMQELQLQAEREKAAKAEQEARAERERQRAIDEMPIRGRLSQLANDVESMDIPRNHPVYQAAQAILVNAAVELRKLAAQPME